MRIRSIKPEFWRSDDIAALPLSARLLFIGLWSYVDDNGVGLDKLPAVAADLFADDLSVDPTETLRRVAVDTTRLSDAGLIVRYQADGKSLLYVTNWESHQIVKNPSRGHCYPLPPGEKIDAVRSLRRLSVDPTETLGTGTGEQGNRGTGDQGGERGKAAPHPTCPRHPDGTDHPCAACKKARLEWDAAQPKKTTPIPDKYGTATECDTQPGYPLPCHRCATEEG